MNRFYRYSMRHGSELLFVLSLLVVLLSIVNTYQTLEQSQLTTGMSISELRVLDRFQLLLSAIAQSLLLGAMPFAAAVLINRIDQFLQTREKSQ